MQATAKNNFFLTDISSYGKLSRLSVVKYGEFYQHLLLVLCGESNVQYSKLAHKIVDIADSAYTLRQSDVVEQASELLLNPSLPQPYQRVGEYYRALAKHQQGKNYEALKLFEQVADDAPLRYRTRAIQLLGMIHHTQGNFDLALSLYLESCRIATSHNGCDPATLLTAQQNIAVMKSMYGDHHAALTHLETLFPLVKSLGTSQPYKYCLYLNSLAVELGEAGRIEEAQNVCRITLASPFINAYPEWRETWQELALLGYKSRSVVSVPKLPLKSNNVVPIPVNNNPILPQKECAKVLDLQAWREQMVKEPNGDEKEKEIDKMSEQDMVLELIGMLTNGEADEKQIRKLLKAALKIFSEK